MERRRLAGWIVMVRSGGRLARWISASFARRLAADLSHLWFLPWQSARRNGDSGKGL
jgi:hypothetical protein